jgi:hypothetical protein
MQGKGRRVREEPRLRGLPTFGLAMAGLVLGHVLAYLIAVPDPHHRAFVLQRTGHEYLPAMAEAALVLSLAGVAAVVIRAFAPGPRGGSDRFSQLAGRLGLVQIVAFGGLEVVERIVAGAPLRHLASDHILVIGMAVQVVVALAGAAFLRWLARTSTKLAGTALPRLPLPRAGTVLASTSVTWGPRPTTFGSIGNVRAPPSP